MLDRLDMKDLAGRLPDAGRDAKGHLMPGGQDVRRSVQDAVDLLRDAEFGDPGTHLMSMINQACKKLLEFDHALARPVGNRLNTE